jgi:hypothetical protein
MSGRGRRPDQVDLTTASWPRWVTTRVRRHIGWVRTEGVARLIEEDELDPFERIPNAWRKARWRRSHDASPRAVPVFLVGVQRSGTNMLVRGLERAPEFEVHNENDRATFRRFRLRSDRVIRSVVTRSHHDYILFKPLCDSHRTAELLDGLDTPSPPKAIWAYRAVDGRVRSAVAKFGDFNLRALARVASGDGSDLWLAQGLSEESLDLIRGFDYSRLSAPSAAALFWYVRNALFFELGLSEREDVILVSYEEMLARPEPTMRALCRFLHLPFEAEYIEHVRPRQGSSAPVDEIDPLIRSRCDVLQQRLDDLVRDVSVTAVDEDRSSDHGPYDGPSDPG